MRHCHRTDNSSYLMLAIPLCWHCKIYYCSSVSWYSCAKHNVWYIATGHQMDRSKESLSTSILPCFRPTTWACSATILWPPSDASPPARFRIAMILSALRIWEDGDMNEIRTCSEDDYQTAMAISEVLQQHMLRVIKELPSSSSKIVTGQAKEPLLLKSLLGLASGRIRGRRTSRL